jgi:hypothetical protein
MCKSDGEAVGNQVSCTSSQQLSLIRQCTAAALNIEASITLGGGCDSILAEIGEAYDIPDLYNTCCTEICNGAERGQDISSSHCIDAIDTFNNSYDTLVGYEEFCPNTLTCSDGSTLVTESPCNADSSLCDASKDNDWVNPGRAFGPPINPKKCE